MCNCEIKTVSIINTNETVVFFVKGQQLMDLENKLRVAKEELEKAALDKVRREMIKSLFNYKLYIFQDQPVHMFSYVLYFSAEDKIQHRDFCDFYC